MRQVKYFFSRDQHFERFNLLSKNYKWLHDVPERQLSRIVVVVSLAQQGKSYIKDT